ncbi:MAG TPA: CapA family protein [Candidatus Acidoferrales bacterium]
MIEEKSNSTAPSLVLWESATADPVAAKIAITGDFLPAGAIDVPAPYGWRTAATALASHFDDIVLSFVNLECPLQTENLPPRKLCGLGQIVSAPASVLDYLDEIRARIVGISNNHAYDYGHEGVARARHAIEARQMIPLGAGRTLSDTPDVFVAQIPGDIRVGFWAAARASHDLATTKSHGCEPATIARATQALASIKSQGAHLSIALLHAGCLRTNRADPEEVRLMDALADCGFTIVAASHSHRIAGAKQVQLRGRDAAASFCFYGLGSIASGYIASPLEREGLIVVVSADSSGKLVRVEVRPVLLSASGFGQVPSPQASCQILERFRSLSAEFTDGSATHLFYRDVSHGLLHLYARDARAAFRESGIRGLARKISRVRVRHIRRAAHRLLA